MSRLFLVVRGSGVVVKLIGAVQADARTGRRRIVPVPGTWTRIEVSGALVRAARHGRRSGAADVLALLDADLGRDGPVTVLTAPQERVEQTALDLVRTHALRAMGAWHVAVASLVVPGLAYSGEPIAFVSRDAAQAAVAERLGFQRI